MFSHGYHGAPSKFSELLSAWARAGYIVAAPQFPLTSNRGAPYDQISDYLNQPGDISYVITQLLDGPLREQIDASRIGAAGLSLGGATTYGLADASCCRDPRLRAAAVFDGIRLPFSEPLGTNSIPLLISHIDTDIALPYAAAEQAFTEAASPKWFLTFFQGIHPEAYEDTPSPHDFTATQTSIDFFDLTLLGDSSAGARLFQDGDNSGESSIAAG
jgi:dienelactone hydrolase